MLRTMRINGRLIVFIESSFFMSLEAAASIFFVFVRGVNRSLGCRTATPEGREFSVEVNGSRLLPLRGLI